MKKILVIEDNEDLAEMLATWLTDHGYEVKAAADGVTAIKEAQKFRPDLILLDMMLPGGNGLSVLQRAKRSTFTHNIPVIVLTASPDPAFKTEALKAGVSGYFRKPVNLKELLAEIQKLLPGSLAEKSQSDKVSG